jgi:hypothetical protein
MICRLTGKVGSPVKAHIVPESFYLIRPEEGPLHLITNTPGRFPKRSPVGVYDSTIVTAEGEAYFTPWDNYAAELLLQGFSKATPLKQVQGKIVGYEYSSFDYTKLKLFFLSVLWRAGASSHEFFRRVNLGPHREVLRKMLINADPGRPDEYAVVLAVFDDDPEWAKIMDPFPGRYGRNGIRFYCLYVGNFIAYVKVDKRPADSPMRELQFAPNTPLRIPRRVYAESKERRIMAKIVRETERRTKP